MRAIDLQATRMPGLALACFLALILLLVGAGPASASASAPLRCTVVGTDRADSLRGTPRHDVICGRGGNDTIRGMGGNDVLLGGRGNDRIDGGAGNDLVNGEAGGDRLAGSGGHDRILGGRGADAIDAGTGRDTAAGGPGRDTIDGSVDADSLSGGAGDDLMRGGAGDDLLSGDAGGDVADGGLGADRAAGGRGSDKVQGGAGDDLLAGGSDSDEVSGGDGDDGVTGGYAEVGKVWVCHWTGSRSGPGSGKGRYVAIHVGVRSLEGHADHPWDVVVATPADCPTKPKVDPTPDTGTDPGDDGSDDIVDGGPGSDACVIEDGRVPAGCEDLAAPKLQSIALDATTIDTGAAPVTVTADLRVTDNLSGVGFVDGDVFLDGVWKSRILVTPEGRVSGTEHDGVWRLRMLFPRYLPAGDYELRLGGADHDNNFSVGDGSAAVQWPTARIRQVDPGDVAAPVSSAIRMSATSVDTSAADATVRFDIDFADDISGLHGITGRVTNPGEAPGRGRGVVGYISSGTTLAGTNTIPVTLARYSPPGTYTVELIAMDNANNTRSLGTRTIEQVGPGDTRGPEVRSVEFLPSAINTTTADVVVRIRVRVVDDVSGFEKGRFELAAPDSAQRQWVSYFPGNRISGTALDGTYEVQVTIPRYSDLGQWTYSTAAVDQAGNATHGGDVTGLAFTNG